MIFNALLVPADITEPLQQVDFNNSKVATWPKLINLPDSHATFTTYRQHGIQVLHDDDAYLRDPLPLVNFRWNFLDAKLVNGGGMRYSNLLSGDMVIIGTDEYGNTDHVPQTILDLMAEIHKEAVVFERKTAEAKKNMERQGGIAW